MKKLSHIVMTCVCWFTVCMSSTTIVRASVVDEVLISEIFYDRVGTDNNFEWVELFNGRADVVDLEGWSLGYGGTTLASAVLPLSGQILPGAYYLVGGPNSDATNGAPQFDLKIDFSPDLQNSGVVADGIGLFDAPAALIDADTVPVDALIYGGANTSQLIGVLGSPAEVDFPDVINGHSIERIALGAWAERETPQPGAGQLKIAITGEPATVALVALGLLVPALGTRIATRQTKKRSMPLQC